MATVATPSRQPFGLLNETKLRSLQSVKNRQNAVIPSSAPSLKRRHASPELSDSENVDPNIFESIKKRKHSSVGDDLCMSKSQRYSLTTIPSTKSRLSTPTAPTRLNTITRPSITPASAPAAAGRSPTKSKPNGILNARRRFAPPSFGHTKSPSLSITAALNGTLASRKVKNHARTIEESKPKSWFFDIYEESQEQQDYTINEWNMTQNAISLEISDEEGRAKAEDRGKENVDPNELPAPVTRSMTASIAKAPRVTRKDMMTDEPRTPLGDLNAADYYAEGLDAKSVVLIQDDEVPEPEAVKEKVVEEAFRAEPVAVQESAFTFNASVISEKMTTAEVGALLMASAPLWETETSIPSPPAEDASIEIWESESAKDENEAREDKENMAGGGIFALAEL